MTAALSDNPSSPSCYRKSKMCGGSFSGKQCYREWRKLGSPVGGGGGCCGTLQVQEENGVEGAAQVQKVHGIESIVQQSAGGRMCKYKKAMG